MPGAREVSSRVATKDGSPSTRASALMSVVPRLPDRTKPSGLIRPALMLLDDQSTRRVMFTTAPMRRRANARICTLVPRTTVCGPSIETEATSLSSNEVWKSTSRSALTPAAACSKANAPKMYGNTAFLRAGPR